MKRILSLPTMREGADSGFGDSFVGSRFHSTLHFRQVLRYQVEVR
jgi:hypothetical protein